MKIRSRERGLHVRGAAHRRAPALLALALMVGMVGAAAQTAQAAGGTHGIARDIPPTSRLLVAPQVGAPGTQVDVEGRDLACQAVTLWFVDVAGTKTALARVSISGGRLSAHVAVPRHAEEGAGGFLAAGPNQLLCSAAADFWVCTTCLGTDAARTESPTVSAGRSTGSETALHLSPSAGIAGEKVAASGTLARSWSEQVALYFGRTLVATGSTNQLGFFSISFIVPQAHPGRHRVTAVGSASHASASGSFVIPEGIEGGAGTRSE